MTDTNDVVERTLHALRWPGAAALTLVLAGCASLSPQQCTHADWRQIGYSDGVKGLSGAQIDEHARACAPQGIRPNLDAYLAGRAQGLASYCQPRNGFELGRSGVSHIIGDCPENLKWAFQDQYKQGSQIYAIESDLDNRRNQFSDSRKKIHRTNERIAEIKSELGRKDLTGDRRNALLGEFETQVNQKENLVHRSLELESHIERLQRQLHQKLKEFGH